MRENDLATRMALPVGAIVFLLALLHFTRVLQMDIWQAMVLGFAVTVVVFVVVWLISYKQFQKREQQQRRINALKAQEEVATMYNRARELISQVREKAMAIEPYNSTTSHKLTQICQHAEVLLQEIKEKRPDSSRASIVVVTRNLEVLLEMALPQYLQMIDPSSKEYFPNAASLIQKANETFDHLEQGFCATVRMLEQEDINRFEVALILLDPFDKSLLV